MKLIEVLHDNEFKNGFKLLGVKPTLNQRDVHKYLKTNNSKDDIHWFLSQWWTPYDLSLGQSNIKNNFYEFKTKSRKVTLENNKLFLYLNGKEEYLGKNRQREGSWAHLLLEQDFVRKIDVNKTSLFNLNLNFNIRKVNEFKSLKYDKDIHAAQFLLYFVVFARDDDEDYNYQGFNQEFLWFGVPLYDNRLDKFEHIYHVDSGAEGTTNRLIYLMDSSNYLKEKIIFNKDYEININLMPHIKKALDFAKKNKYINQDAKKYEIGYLNIGWEIPGAYEVEASINKISIKTDYLKGR
ncbi:MAG: hypothetical protein WC907_07120 [Acholeplasmataceae bacterium]